MKIVLISGSRSDRNALVMVEKALIAAGHDAKLVDYVSKNLHPDLKLSVMAAHHAMELTSFLGIGEEDSRFADMAFVHGDRYEALSIAFACNVMGIPIAHIGGGDITEGSQDDCFRHAITKLSHLHFVSNQGSADRIVQMGEEPDRVHVTGCPGIDMVMATPTLDRVETFASIDLCAPPCTESQSYHMTKEWREMCERPAPQRSLLVLFHPNTLGDTAAELKALSDALMARTEALVLLGPNADAGSDLIRKQWNWLANFKADTVYHDTVEPALFYSLLNHCDVLVGNSSAGFYEAPYFGTPVVNLGQRQRGRFMSDNIDQCNLPGHAESISGRINLALEHGRIFGLMKPYGDGHAAERIAKVIGGIKDPRALLRKRWHQVPTPYHYSMMERSI